MGIVKHLKSLSWQQIALLAACTVAVVAVGVRVVGLIGERSTVMRSLDQATAKQAELEAERARLDEELRFYQSPDNLEKELRARFNFKRPEERVIIVLPPQKQTEQ